MPELRIQGGAVIWYDVRGPADGEPMVLVEGLGAHLFGWRDEFCDLLVAAGYRVVRFDNRDVGLSQKYPGVHYSLADLADDTHALVEGLGLAPAHVVGQSMGGMVAQELVVRHPADVRSLSLLYTTASEQHLLGGDRDPETLAALPVASSREEAVERHVAQEQVCASRAYPFDASWKAELGGIMWDRCYDPAGVVRQREALEHGLPSLDDLARTSVPTTIVHGEADRLISPDGSRQLHATIPGSELWVVDGMGHELPRELWPAITDRIVGNARRATASAEATRAG